MYLFSNVCGFPTIVIVVVAASRLWISIYYRVKNLHIINETPATYPIATSSISRNTQTEMRTISTVNQIRILKAKLLALESRNMNRNTNKVGGIALLGEVGE